MHCEPEPKLKLVCSGRWNGVECRAIRGGALRIVTLDIHNVDLTGRDLPWETVGRLDALEELNFFNCKLGGSIVAAALCGLAALRVLVLSQVIGRLLYPFDVAVETSLFLFTMLACVSAEYDPRHAARLHPLELGPGMAVDRRQPHPRPGV